jgi:putative FmdB family regulatory protein
MPIYEYRRQDCGEATSFFLLAIGDALTPICGHCQSANMQRQMSSFAMGRGSGGPMGGSSYGSESTGLEYSRGPRNIRRNVEESFSRHGLDVPESVRETIKSARAGKLPKGMDI